MNRPASRRPTLTRITEGIPCPCPSHQSTRPTRATSSSRHPTCSAEAALRVGASYPELFRHQTAGVAFLLSRRRAILADDMGLGKTRTAIVAAREEAPDGPFLVICPASVKLNWRREIQLVEPGADVHVLAGGAAPFEPGHRWTVVNYDLVSRHREALGGGRLGGDHRRRGALHQERLGALAAHARAARRRRQAAVRRARRRLPADRHADGQPAARPVQPAQGRAPPAGHELLPATPSATARRSTTATASTPTARRTSTSWPRSCPA